MQDLFAKITEISNIREAYFELVEKLDKSFKSAKYSGIDNLTLQDIESQSERIFREIREELLAKKNITRVMHYEVPKSTGNGMRNIFIYTVKERIKAQAIYRVVEPFFEEAYSDFLFSYRSSHASYYAARSAVRRYKRRYGEDNLLLMDFTAYSDYIDHSVLTKTLLGMGFNEDVMDLFNLFIKVNVFSKNYPDDNKVGLWQGVPLIALFANIYLNDLDHSIGKKVQFYRRVGDDLMLADPDAEKIKTVFKEVKDYADSHKLIIQPEKTKLILNSEKFSFLGYSFEKKRISIKESGIKRILARWKKSFRYSDKPKVKKLEHLNILCEREEYSLEDQFKLIVEQYMFVDDDMQMKWLYDQFIKILVKYFYRTYSEKKHRDTLNLINTIELPSLYKYYLDLHHGKTK